MYIYMCSKGTCHLFLCCSLPCSLETGSFSVTLSSLLVWLIRELLGATRPPHPQHPATLQCIQAFIAMPSFLCDCQVFKFGPSCLHCKCSYPTGHLSSPTSRGKKYPFFPLCFGMMLNPDVDCSFDKFQVFKNVAVLSSDLSLRRNQPSYLPLFPCMRCGFAPWAVCFLCSFCSEQRNHHLLHWICSFFLFLGLTELFRFVG